MCPENVTKITEEKKEKDGREKTWKDWKDKVRKSDSVRLMRKTDGGRNNEERQTA